MVRGGISWFTISLILLTCAPWITTAKAERRLVKMTLVRNALAQGAVCLDGSLPAYHLDRGFGSGTRNWLLQFEGGGWCNDLESCLERAKTRRGSTRYMSKLEVFSGILSNNASLNPVVQRQIGDRAPPLGCVEVWNMPTLTNNGMNVCLRWNRARRCNFYNWNRVKLRYCDGASFAGNSMFSNQTTKLYFRGQRIWKAIVQELLPLGLNHTDKALLSGCSAGGLATFLHCDNFTSLLPSTAHVKCLSDAGFFLNIRDISLQHPARTFFENLVTLQGVEPSLDTNCTRSRYYPHECFFPQYALPYIKTPYFILNSAYDVYQFHHNLVPPSTDLHGLWSRCKSNPVLCNPHQLEILQGFRHQMIQALLFFYEYSKKGGMYINSCFAHCQSESQDTWFAPDSPRVHNKTIAEAVGDWYFGRRVTKEIDCPYPCDNTCHNLL